MTTSRTAHGDAAWTSYLDALESGVQGLDGQLAEGGAPSPEEIDELERIQPPAGTLPARLQPRQARLLALLAEVTYRATARRDALLAELHAMPRRRSGPRTDAPATLGGTLDIVS